MKVPPQSEKKPKNSVNTQHQIQSKSALKRCSNIIDQIFKSKKQQKQQEKIEQQKQKSSAEVLKQKKEKKIAKELKKQWRIEEKLRKANDGQIPSTKKVQSGIKIYTEQQLKIGKGGNTKLCPIDCNCCF